jgi:TonB family protein
MFSTVLDDAGQPAASRRGLRLPFGAAFGLHAGALAFILAARAWSFQEPPDPPIPIVFYAPPGAPPLGDEGDGTPARAEKRKETPPTKAEERTPENVPDVAPDTPADTRAQSLDATESRNPSPSDRSGDGEGDGSKTKGSSLGSAVGKCPDCPPTEIDRGGTEKVYRPGGDVRDPILTLRIEPVYPEAARKLHAQGVVIVDAVISATGVVEEVRVVKSAHPLLDAAAVDAVGRWRYSPATLNGRAVRVLLSVTVRFSLH